MRILFVVQRYGAQVPGGAELAAREFATRLAARGHAAEVLTSCAVSYVDWANAYPPGTEELDGVLVHRLPVSEPREDRIFGPMHARVPFGRHRVPPFMQRDWMRVQGPNLPGLTPWLREHATSYDRIVFFTYLYFPASAGLPAAAGLVPTVLHPTAHDEPPLYLSLFDLTFRLPSALAFLTEEEAELVANRFHVRLPSTVTGLGVELNVAASDEDITAFRAGVAAACRAAPPAAAAVASPTGASPSSRRRSIWFARTRAWPEPSAGPAGVTWNGGTPGTGSSPATRPSSIGSMPRPQPCALKVL